MTSVRRFGVSMIAAGLMFGLVACSGSEEVATDDPSTVETTSPDTATDTPATDTPTTSTGPAATDTPVTDASPTETADPAVPVLSEKNFASELTAAQTAAGSAHIEATIGASGQTGKMVADVDGLGNGDNLAMDLSLDIAGQQLKMVLVDKAFYIQGAGISSDPAKPWVKIDISDPNNPFAQLFDASNPANFTAYLEGVTGFQDKGIETVDGVEARHYSVTVDTAKMLAANPAFKGQDVSSLGLPDEVTSEVYVNGDNLPVEISVAMGSAGSFEAHFSKYGEPVDVKAPPASQVSEFSL
jgi:hypothetical protein